MAKQEIFSFKAENFNSELKRLKVIYESHSDIYFDLIVNSYEFVQTKIDGYNAYVEKKLEKLDDEGKQIFRSQEGDEELSVKYETPKRHYFTHILALISFLENNLNRYVVDIFKVPVTDKGEPKFFKKLEGSKISKYNTYLIDKNAFENENPNDYFSTISSFYSSRNKIVHSHDWSEEFLDLVEKTEWLDGYEKISAVITSSKVKDRYLLKNFKSTLALYYAIKEYLSLLYKSVK